MDMKHVKYLALVLCIGNLSPVMAQTASKSLTVDNLVAWQRISGQAISDNGKWVACKMESWEGDAVVNLYDAQGKELATFPRADRFLFSASSDYLVVSQKPGKMIVDSLKIKKTKKEKMPMDALVIYSLSGGREVIDSLKTFRLAEKADWVAFQKGRKDSTLYVQPLNANLSTRYEAPAVKAFNFAEKSGMLYYITAGDKAEEKSGLYLLNTETGVKTLIKEGDGVFKQVTFDEDGANLAFLYCAQKDSCYKAMSLWLSQQGAPATEVAARGNRAFPKGWVISEHGKLQFSKSASRLFFGTSPEPRQKDTLQLAENRPNVQVWSWDEPVQYTVQDYNKEKELKRSYQAVYHIMVVVFVSWQMRSCLRFCWEMKEMPRWHCFPLRVLIHCPPCGKGGHAVIITQCLWKMAAVNYWHRRIMADTVFHHKASMRIGMLKQTVVGILFLWQTGKKSVDYPRFFPRMG